MDRNLYDCQGRVKGLTHATTQAPQDGNFYLATRIWVRDAAGACLFLRCADTDSWTPGQWTVPSGGPAAGVQGQDAARQTLRTPAWSHPNRCPVAEPGRPALSGQPQRHPLSRHRASFYLVQLPDPAPANVVLGETLQAWQWVPAEDVSVFLTDHSVEPFTRLSHRQYSHRLLP
ncbi:MAG: hypothetical protein V8S71_03300 [Oscillospiraceae bacterium]